MLLRQMTGSRQRRHDISQSLHTEEIKLLNCTSQHRAKSGPPTSGSTAVIGESNRRLSQPHHFLSSSKKQEGYRMCLDSFL